MSLITTDNTLRVPDSLENDEVLLGLLSEVSAKTAQVYGPTIKEFLLWVESNGPYHPAVALSMYMRYLLEVRGNSRKTVNKKRVAIRRFFEWAAVLGKISNEDYLKVKQVNGLKVQGKRAGNWLTKEQMQELLNLPDTTTVRGRRDRAALALFLGCALRRSEVVTVQWEQIKKYGNTWRIENLERKHGKVQEGVPLPDWVVRILGDWQECFEEPTGNVIVSVDKYGNLRSSITFQGVYNIVKHYCELLGLDEISPHDLRRSWARAAFKNNAPMSQIQQVLGHESITVTEQYINDTLDYDSAATFVDLET